jgi:hypothetical protein
VPPIREPLEEIHLSAAWPPSSPAPPQTYTIPTLSYAARTCSRPSIQHAHSSSSSVRRSRSPLRITILSDPAREKQRAEQHRPTQSRQIVSSALSITPISILKKPGTNGKGAELNGHSVKGKVLLPEVVVYGPVSCEPQAKTDVHFSGTDIGTDTTGYEEILGVPAVNSRSKLDENDLARYYPKEHAAEQIVRRLRSMVRSGSRLAAARRRERARQGGQIATTPFSSDLLIASRTSAHTSTLTPTGKIPITPTPRDPYGTNTHFSISVSNSVSFFEYGNETT